MRYLILVYPGVDAEQGSGVPDAEMVQKMTRFNETMAKAGVLRGLEGLHPTLRGARVTFGAGESKVVRGPLEGPRLVGGYWIIEVTNLDEAISWARKAPMKQGDVLEIRQIFEIRDFPDDVQRAAGSEVIQAELHRRK